MTRIEAAIQMYERGATLRDISAALGSYPATWRRRLTAKGVALRPPGRPAKLDLVAAQALIDFGVKQYEVARHFGVTAPTISAAIADGRLRKRRGA